MMNSVFWYNNCSRLAVLAVLAFVFAFFSVCSLQTLDDAPADWYSDSKWVQAYVGTMLLMMPVPLLLCGWALKTLLKKDRSSDETDRESRLQWQELPVLAGIHAFLIGWISVCVWFGVESWHQLQYEWNLDSTLRELSTDMVRIVHADAFLGSEDEYHESTRLSKHFSSATYFHVVGNCLSIQILDKEFDDAKLVELVEVFQSRGLLTEQNVWCLDVSESRVTDNSIRFLTELQPNKMPLRVLVARDTALTSNCLDGINKLGLTVLDVRDTSIRLADFEDFNYSGFYALTALYLSADPDQQHEQSNVEFSGLKYMYLTDGKTTQPANYPVAPPLKFFEL